MVRINSMSVREMFRSRFGQVTRSTRSVVYPFESVGVRSAQYLGAQSVDPNASVRLSRDGYVVETDD